MKKAFISLMALIVLGTGVASAKELGIFKTPPAAEKELGIF